MSRRAISGGVVLGLLILLLIAGAGYTLLNYTSPHTATIVVERHYIDNSGSSSHYVIVANGTGTLYEVDSPWWKPFDNSVNPDTNWAKVIDGHTFCLTYAGWYIPAWPIYSYWYTYGIKAGSC